VSLHVPVPPHLRLEPYCAHVAEYIERHDPELRIRKSAEKRWCYVLERRCRRAPATNAGLGDYSDLHIQARDGYVHVSLVHPQYMTRPWNIVRGLLEEGVDLFAQSAHKVADELDYEERWAKESRRRRRLGLFRDIAVDAFPILDRLGNRDGTERTRISVPDRAAA